jgi:hypothetical protein
VKKLVPVKPSLRDERNFAEVVKEGVMARDVEKEVADLARDRQGGRAEDENRFKNCQEGDGSGGFRGGADRFNNSGCREGQGVY